MPSHVVSAWIVAIIGWSVLAFAALWAVYYAIDALVRLVGVAGWFYATAREVQARHGWRDELAPWWLKILNETNEPPDWMTPLLRRFRNRK